MMEGWPSGNNALLTARLPYKYAIPLVAAAFVIAMASMVVPAWASPDAAKEQSVQQESGPRSYHRGISDGLSVTSNFGNPAIPNNTPRSYTRSLSETVSVASSFQSPSHSALAESQGPQRAPANYSPAAGQRVDERSGNRILLGNKGDSRINSATQYSGAPQATQRAPAEGDFDFSEVATLGDGGGSEPDDNLVRYIVATTAADHYSGASTYANAVFGTYSLAVIIIVAARSHRFAGAGRTVVRLGIAVLPARLVASSVQAGNPARQTRSLLIAIVAVLAVVSVGSAVGQAFADSAAGIAYKSNTGTNTINSPKYREWDPSTTSWGATEVELPTSGAQLYAVKFLYSPSSSLRVIGTLGSDGEIEIYYCDNDCTTASKWTGPILVADMGTPTAGYKYFDIAFEASSGDLLIVYDKTVTETADFYYKTFNSITLTLSGESSFNYIGGVTSDTEVVNFFKMASKPGTDNIAMILLDNTNQDAYAFIWDGSNFGNQLTVSSTTGATSITGESIGVAYETSSGAALVFSGNGANSAAWARYTTLWSSVTTGDPNSVNGNDVKWVSIKADPASGSDKVMVCQVDDLSDFTCSEFNAGSAGTWTQLENNVGGNTVRRGDFAWDPTGSTGFTLYYDNADIARRTWTSGTSTWSGPTSVAVVNAVFWVVGATDFDSAATGIDSLWAIYGDATTDDIGDGEWDAGAGIPWVLNGETTVTADAGTVNTVEVVALDSQKSRNVKRYISDSLNLTNADTISINITPDILEPDLNIGDAISTNIAPAISEPDLNIGDAIARVLAASRSVPDSLAVGDSISIHVTRSITDTLAVGDAIAAAKNVNKPVSDPLTVGDSISIHVTRSIADAVTVADAVARVLNASRSTSDTLAAGDSIAMSVTRSMSESLTVSETIASTYLASRSTSDTVNITDSIARTVATSASISDSLGVTDSPVRTLAASRTASDTLAVADSMSMHVTRSTSDSLAAADSVAASLAASRSTSDTLAVSDAITSAVTRSISDTLSMTDSIAATKTFSRSMADALAVTDSVEMSVTRSLSDTLAASDSIAVALNTSRTAPDTVTVSDSISMSVTRSLADTLAVADSIAPAVSKSASISDTLALGDSISMSVTRSLADVLAASDAIATTYSASRSASDALNVTDSIAADKSFGRSAPDTVTVTDGIAATAVYARSASDSLTVTDSVVAALTGVNRPASDTLAVTDSIVSTYVASRSIADALAITDSISTGGGSSPNVGETLAVTDAITEVSVHWNRDFTEAVVLGDCTPFACNQALVFGEALAIGAGITPPPSAADSIAFTDNVAITVGRSLSDSVSVTPMAGFIWIGVPPPPVASAVPPVSLMIASNSTLVGPLPGAPVNGTYALVTPGQLVTLLNPPALTNGAVAVPDLPSTVMVLPTYHVNLTPTAQLPGDDLLLTGMVDQIPAGTPVAVPVNIASTPEMTEHGHIPWMMVEYTPNADSTNFALLATVIDAPPAGAQQPPGALKPMYIDFAWIGNFSASDPSASGYYSSPPTVTFAVTDSWATSQNVQRNANGVPVMSMSLLNPSTGAWTPVSIDLPAGQVNGQYRYVAHLDHFSTYAITANVGGGPVVMSSGRGGTSYAVQLADALTVTGEGRVLETIEEFGQKSIRVGIVDALVIAAKPVSFKTLKVGENVEVNIGVQDVEQASVIPPKAEVTIEVRAENSGTDQEKFELIFSYYDPTGKKAYESSQVIELAPGESRIINVNVPFTSPGTFDMIADVRSVPEGELLNTTQLRVTVPWLTINLYLLIVAAAVILGGSGASIILFVRRKA